MKIGVCIKQVPDTTDIRVNPETGSLCREGVVSIINPDDRYALEEALRLKDVWKAQVIVITMGPPQAEIILRESMAMGADKSILISDKSFAGSDTYVTSKILSEALKKLEVDIVFTGRQAIDGDTAQVGPQIAEFLGYPHVSYVKNIETEDGKTFIVTRAIESGYQRVKVSSPCLFTVLGKNNRPRYMGGGYYKNVEVWTIEDIGLSPTEVGFKGSPTKVYRSFNKPPRGKCKVYEVSDDESVNIIYEELKRLHII